MRTANPVPACFDKATAKLPFCWHPDFRRCPENRAEKPKLLRGRKRGILVRFPIRLILCCLWFCASVCDVLMGRKRRGKRCFSTRCAPFLACGNARRPTCFFPKRLALISEAPCSYFRSPVPRGPFPPAAMPFGAFSSLFCSVPYPKQKCQKESESGFSLPFFRVAAPAFSPAQTLTSVSRILGER